MPEATDTTQLLISANAGDRDAFDALYARLYDELRQIARHRLLNSARGETLNTAVLVHEADTLLSQALAIRSVQHGPDHLDVAETQALLALVLRDLGETLRLASRFGEADSVLGEAVDILRARTERPDQQMIGILTSRANTLQGQARRPPRRAPTPG